MAKKTPIDRLSKSIEKILTDYQNDTTITVGDLAKKFTQKGALTIRSEASGRGWGENTGYDKGWTSRFETGRLSAQGVIYNKDVPGLPHLLENGHAKRNGGRTRANPHIAPVEKKITDEFEKAVMRSI